MAILYLEPDNLQPIDLIYGLLKPWMMLILQAHRNQALQLGHLLLMPTLFLLNHRS
jgi:hypothetical protein